jgi:Fungal specific transcription factor domain
MHHFSTETSLSIMPMVEVQRLFQLQIPEYALTEPQLMRGLMSLSAFHLAYKRPAEASLWMPLAFKHQTTVLRSLRMIMSNTNRDNCRTLFCLSMILGITALSSATCTPALASNGVPDMDEIIQPIIILRGTSELGRYAQDLKELFINGPMAAFVKGYFIMSDTSAYLPKAVAEQFQLLKDLIIRKYPDDETRQYHLLASLKWLEKIYSEVGYTKGTANNNMCMVWKWMGHATEVYMSYLKEHDPGALIIFAYFAILSKLFKSSWFLQGWAEHVVRGIENTLKDPDFLEALQWTSKQLESDLGVFPREVNTKILVQV